MSWMQQRNFFGRLEEHNQCKPIWHEIWNDGFATKKRNIIMSYMSLHYVHTHKILQVFTFSPPTVSSNWKRLWLHGTTSRPSPAGRCFFSPNRDSFTSVVSKTEIVIHLDDILVFSNWTLSTLPETNMALENRPPQKESSLSTIHFQVLCYREGIYLESTLWNEWTHHLRFSHYNHVQSW